MGGEEILAGLQAVLAVICKALGGSFSVLLHPLPAFIWLTCKDSGKGILAACLCGAWRDLGLGLSCSGRQEYRFALCILYQDDP